MDKLEKIVWIVTGIAVLIVIAFAAIGPLKSELSDKVIADDFDRLNPGFAQRKQRPNVPMPGRMGGPQAASSFPAPAGTPRVAQAATVRQVAQPGQPQPAQPLPVSPPTAGQPYNPGVTVANTPVVIPESMASKYQHFEDVVQLGMTAYGEDVTLPDGSTGFQLQEIQEDSALATRLGFQAGDTIISVNGYPASKGNARQLYDALKNERTFNVVVLRAGQQQTLTFNRQ